MVHEENGKLQDGEVSFRAARLSELRVCGIGEASNKQPARSSVLSDELRVMTNQHCGAAAADAVTVEVYHEFYGTWNEQTAALSSLSFIFMAGPTACFARESFEIGKWEAVCWHVELLRRKGALASCIMPQDEAYWLLNNV
eukprot:g21615.t1